MSEVTTKEADGTPIMAKEADGTLIMECFEEVALEAGFDLSPRQDVGH